MCTAYYADSRSRAYNKVFFRRFQRNKRLQHPDCDSEQQHQRVSFLTFDAVDRVTEYRTVNKSHSAFFFRGDYKTVTTRTSSSTWESHQTRHEKLATRKIITGGKLSEVCLSLQAWGWAVRHTDPYDHQISCQVIHQL